MDLERLLIEWQERKFEGYLFETPPSAILAEVRKEAAKRNRRYKLRNFAGIGLGVLVGAAALVTMFLEHSFIARGVTLLLMIALFYELLWMLQWQAGENRKAYYLPRKSFLVAERDRVTKKIRQTWWQWVRCAIAGCGLAAFLLFPNVMPAEDALDFFVAFLIPFLVMHFLYLVTMTTELPRTLEKIEGEIKKLDLNPQK